MCGARVRAGVDRRARRSNDPRDRIRVPRVCVAVAARARWIGDDCDATTTTTATRGRGRCGAGATGAGASGAARARAPAAVDADAVANGVLLGADDDARREGAGRATRATSAEGGTTATATATATIGTACRAIAVLACVVAVIGGVVYASTRLEIDLYEDVVPHVKNPVKFFLLNVAVASFGVIPGAASATCVTAGILFGTLGGMALCVTSASVGAVVSFTLSRYVARPWVEKAFVRDGGRLKALDDAVIERWITDRHISQTFAVFTVYRGELHAGIDVGAVRFVLHGDRRRVASVELRVRVHGRYRKKSEWIGWCDVDGDRFLCPRSAGDSVR